MPQSTEPKKTIKEALAEFLAEQKPRLAAKTYRKYDDIVDLLKSYCESYWPGHDGEYDRVTEAGGKYCTTYGPEDIPQAFSEFLGYFMPRKVICGKETMTAAGTVVRKLGKWLAAKGYAEEEEAEGVREMARNMGGTHDVFRSLGQLADWEGPSEEECDQVVQDHFWVHKVEPGKLWLEPLLESDSVLGPFLVPEAVTDKCRVGWDIGGVVGRTRKRWQFIEVWNVSP